MDLDARTQALILARARVVAGLAMLALPSVAGRIVFGRTTAESRALFRMVGVRDVVLGVGAITSLKEQTQDSEWVGMGAVSDGIDAVALFLAPAPLWRRVMKAIPSVGAAVQGISCARQLADARPPTAD